MSNKIYAGLAYGSMIPEDSGIEEETLDAWAGGDPNIEIFHHRVSRNEVLLGIRIKGSYQLASSRDNPTLVQGDLQADPRWRGLIEEFSQKHGLGLPPPSWVLFVDWDV